MKNKLAINKNQTEILNMLSYYGDYVTGEEIGASLGLTRAAIWKEVDNLRASGFEIDSIRNRGYRLLKTASGINPATINALLDFDVVPKLDYNFYSVSESTLNLAKEATRVPHRAPLLIVSNDQQGTRGRFGRSFFAVPDKGIYATLLLKPEVDIEEIASYTIVAGVALAKTFEKYLPKRKVEIKWVNDVFVDGKKVAGILSEAVANVEMRTVTDIAIGFGINYTITKEEFGADLSEIVTSLFPDGNATVTREALLADFLNFFFELLKDKTYLDYHREHSFTIGKDVEFALHGTDYKGVAVDIDSKGELIVRLEDGTTMSVSSGEVSLRKR
ncbi:MAG: biotin--[acetyl-CoA-carboxylase] ligase [Lactobacillales bacterium]|jgi:BirA family biotin operon repressor/biotin-[acetyl-CoA-carboxylase] ligase|nr:biotin--[acetyl-CoA-carboxylase] ligase [Lactobacillales bacterium]